MTRRLTRSSISDDIVAVIRERVNSGMLKPGERILEATLAGELGVSRSPLREALARLSSEGLVRTEPHRGTYVTPIDVTRLRQLLEFRLVLEDFAVRRIIESSDNETMSRLREALDAVNVAAQSSDLNATSDTELQFHERLIELSGNLPLRTAYTGLLNELRLYIRTTLEYYHSAEEITTELEPFLMAIRERRLEDALRLLRVHVEHGYKEVVERLSRS